MTSKSSKPKLLLVSGLAPWPTTSGGAVRVLETIRYLSESYAIHFVCAVSSDQDVVTLQERVGSFCVSFSTFRLQPKKSFFSFFSRGIPYWLSEWYNPELAIIVRNLITRHSIHLVQIETSQLLYLVPLLPTSVFSICTAYDVQLVTFWRRVLEAQNWLTTACKLPLLVQIWHYERSLLPKLNLVSTVSEVDQKYLTHWYGLQNTLVVSNGYQQSIALKHASQRQFTLGYIGSVSHAPNQTAIQYLITQLAPKLQTEIGAFELVLAGDTKELNQNLLAPQKNFTIRQLGYLENVADFYSAIDVLVAPLFSGSGSRIKILESLAHGIPVVTTAVGAEGLAGDSAETGILLANSPEQFVTQIIKIKNRKNSARTEIKPISLTWQAIFQEYRKKIEQYTNKNQTPA